MKFLMCAPYFFGVNYVINPWMKGQQGKVNAGLAMDQWINLRRKVSHLGEIVLVQPRVGMPDMSFTANAGFVLNKLAILSNFRHKERKGEETFFEEWFRNNNYYALKCPPDFIFEGAGDALNDPGRDCVWIGSGFRSNFNSTLVASIINRRIFKLRLADPRFYHLDTCFCPLDHKYIMYYPGAFEEKSLEVIRSHVPTEYRIEVSEEDALNFACNAVEIYDHIIMNDASWDLQRRLRRVGFEPIITPLAEFMKAGGAAKCLTLRLD